MKKLVSSLPENDPLHIALALLELLGEYLHYSSKKLIMYRAFNITVLVVLLLFVIGPLFQTGNKKYEQIMEALLTVMHTLIKYLLFIYNKPYLEKLLDESAKIQRKDTKFKQNFLVIEAHNYEMLRTIQLFLPLVIFIIICYMLKPSFDHSMFLIETLAVESIYVNAIVLALEYYLFVLIIPILFSYDCLYIAQCANVIFQLKRLNHRLQNISTDISNNSYTELVDLIKHHQYLNRMFLQLRSIFSVTLLFHYFVTLYSCCVEIYGLMTNSIQFPLKQAIHVLILFIQFGYYVYPAQEISTEILNMSHSVYMSYWYQNNVKFQKLVFLMMVKAQSGESFSGGGIIPMNMETFGVVVRRSFSFYAILRNVINQQ